MRELKLRITENFARDLRLLMQKRKLTNPSDAIRIAVREAVAKIRTETFSFAYYIGAALKEPLNSRPRFKSDEDLW